MSPMVKLLVLALAVPALSCATSPQPVPRTLQAGIDRIVDEAALSGRTIAVSLTDLEEGISYGRNDHEIMHAASTMKVPVMLALMEAVDRGELRFEQPVPVRNEFRSIVDGSEFTLIAGEDGDPDLYDQVGSSAPLEELMRRMIVRSSNLATNLLIELATPTRVMDLMSRIGARDIEVLRGVEDEKAYEAGLNNVATAHDLMLVMKAIAERKAISRDASERMLAILEQQEFRSKIPAGLPPGTRVANKTGTITRISHDAAIVYPPGRRPYVLVVLTRGYDDGSVAASQIAAVSSAVWDHLGNARNR
ncbi:MAG TPA: serine hydrolase [Thermoanaerobaculia bacterium]|nr:serine hydrolase [Thermoanaerobaculia bacterium]